MGCLKFDPGFLNLRKLDSFQTNRMILIEHNTHVLNQLQNDRIYKHVFVDAQIKA